MHWAAKLHQESCPGSWGGVKVTTLTSLCILLLGIYPQQLAIPETRSKSGMLFRQIILFPIAMCWHEINRISVEQELPVLKFVVSWSSVNWTCTSQYPAACCCGCADTAVWAGLWSRLGLLIHLGAFWKEGMDSAFLVEFVQLPHPFVLCSVFWQLEVAGCSSHMRAEMLSQCL